MQALAEFPQLGDTRNHRRLLYDAIRRMLSAQVYDVIEATQAAMEHARPGHVDDVRRMPVLVRFGESMRKESHDLKRFLFHNLYRHPRVVQTTDQAKQVVRDLFAMYLERPDEMKPSFAARVGQGDDAGSCARVVADFIAGMTDRYAAREHERLTGQQLLV